MRPSRPILLAALCLAAPLRAAPTPPDTARADALFREGRALMDKGELAEACPKLEESFRIAPRLGTMLNLGGCFEKRGQLSRALAVYEHAATMARDAGRADRERAARELAARLERKVGKLIVELDPTPVDGLVVDVDGEAISLRGGLVPIDPGKRVVRARAPGKRAWSTEVTAAPGATVRVAVPALAAEDTASAAPPTERPDRPAPPPPPMVDTRSPPWRTAVVATSVVVGVAGVTLGTVFGLRARGKRDDSQPHCDALGCDAQGVALIDQAKSAGNVSTVSFVVGGVGLAAAAIVFFAVPARSPVIATGDGLRVVF
jgi:hypothetical protein